MNESSSNPPSDMLRPRRGGRAHRMKVKAEALPEAADEKRSSVLSFE